MIGDGTGSIEDKKRSDLSSKVPKKWETDLAHAVTIWMRRKTNFWAVDSHTENHRYIRYRERKEAREKERER